MKKTAEPLSHALKMGTPLNAMVTKCGIPLKDKRLKGCNIGTTLATTTCVACAAVIEAENELTKYKREPVADALRKYYDWALEGDSGISSKTLVQAITGANLEKRPSVPWDPSDLGRCLRVLAKFPELRDRLHLVAEKHADWRGLIDNWPELEALFAEEAPSGRAPKLYARMQQLLGGR